MDPGSCLLELFPESIYTDWFVRIINNKSMKYAHIRGVSSIKPDILFDNSFEFNFSTPIKCNYTKRLLNISFSTRIPCDYRKRLLNVSFSIEVEKFMNSVNDILN